MDLDKMTLGELKTVQRLFGQVSTPPANSAEDHGIQIVILDRGFIYVGRVSTDASWCYIRDAKNVRRWGTTKGLGELVNGPLSGTKLDDTGNVQAPMRSVIGFVAVEEEKWNSIL
ncbi:MAG: hypothetical protein WC455_20585 [Dehalococcoidia bacterium]